MLLFRFNATADTSCLEIEVTDDYIPELQEQVTLQLDANATFVMLSPDTATINIADNDSKLADHPHTCMYMYAV